MKIFQKIFLMLLVMFLITPMVYTQYLENLPQKVKEYIEKLNSYRENVTVIKEEFIGEIEPDKLQQVDMLQLTLYKVSKEIENLPDEEFKNPCAIKKQGNRGGAIQIK